MKNEMGRRKLSSRPKVLMLCNNDEQSFGLLYGLRQAGAIVHLADDKDSPLRFCRLAREFHTIPNILAEEDPAAFVRAVNHVHENERFDCIVQGYSVQILNKLGSQIQINSFPIPPIETYERLDDKWAFYQLCLDAGIRVPKTQFYRDKAALKAGWRPHGGKVVIKPCLAAGSDGIIIATSLHDLEDTIFDNSDYQHAPLIVQDFVAGSDIGLSLLAQDGQVVKCSTQTCEGQDFVFVDHPNYLECCKELIARTGYTGVANFDARISEVDGKVYLLECNPRFWGSILASLYCGVNFFEEGLLLAQGLPVTDSSIQPGTRSISPRQALRDFRQLNFKSLNKRARLWGHVRYHLSYRYYDLIKRVALRLTHRNTAA